MRAHVRKGRLDAECEDDDPRDHRQVQVGEGVAGHPGPNRLVGLAKLPLGDGRDDVEVDPPERRDDRDAQQCRDDDSGSEPACADAEGDDRLAEGDDDDQAVTFCEVGRIDAPVLRAAEPEPAVVDR